MKRTGSTVLIVFVVLALIVGAYIGYWWLRHDTTERSGRLRQDTYGRQNALTEAVLDDIREAETPGIPANQRQAIIDQICDNAAKLNGTIDLPSHAQNFLYQECP